MNAIINLLPNILRTALVGGVLVNDTSDQVITQITGATDIHLLLGYIAIAAIQLVSVWMKTKSAN